MESEHRVDDNDNAKRVCMYIYIFMFFYIIYNILCSNHEKQLILSNLDSFAKSPGSVLRSFVGTWTLTWTYDFLYVWKSVYSLFIFSDIIGLAIFQGVPTKACMSDIYISTASHPKLHKCPLNT